MLHARRYEDGMYVYMGRKGEYANAERLQDSTGSVGEKI